MKVTKNAQRWSQFVHTKSPRWGKKKSANFSPRSETTNVEGDGGWVPGSNGGREMYGRPEKRGRETGYPKGREPGEIGNEFRNIAQYFAIEKAHISERGALREEAGTGSTRYGKREIQTPSPPPTHTNATSFLWKSLLDQPHHLIYPPPSSCIRT